MKILYAIQGTGNGHLARAMEIVPLLREIAETDVLISGSQADLNIPFSIQYQFTGLSFIFGKKGGIDIGKTILKLRPFQFFIDILKLPVKKYDLILTDFEPVSAWACKIRNKKCVGLSHQNAVLHPASPKPVKKDWMGKFVLKHYSPVNVKYGFQFKQLDSRIFMPVIRAAIRDAKPSKNGYYTVYLPAFSNEEIEKVLLQFPQVKWEVFSKHNNSSYKINNILFQPISVVGFNQSFINCEGILCTAGFETPAEALYLGKKLCVVPMKNQYEQACNAAFLSEMGVTVLPDLENQQLKIKLWLESNEKIRMHYPHLINKIIRNIVKNENGFI